jgi:putative modified peptide
MGGKIDATPDEAHELLKKFAEDDEFRQSFEDDPRGVLRDWSIEIDQHDLNERGPLPSKEEFARELERFQERDKTGETQGNAAYFIVYKVLGAMPFVAGDAAD